MVDTHRPIVLECIPQQIEHALPSWQVGVIPELEAEGFSGLTVKPDDDFNIYEIIGWAVAGSDIVYAKQGDLALAFTWPCAGRVHIAIIKNTVVTMHKDLIVPPLSLQLGCAHDEPVTQSCAKVIYSDANFATKRFTKKVEHAAM